MNVHEDIKGIVSGKYKNYHRAWLFSLFLIVYFFIPVPALAFSDNFEDQTFNAWDTVPAGYAITSGSFDGSYYAYSSGIFQSLVKNDATTYSYWAITFKSTTTNAASFFYRYADAANYCNLNMDSAFIHTYGGGACSGITDINYASISDYWYKIAITDTGTVLHVSIMNATNNTELKYYNIADTPLSSQASLSIRSPNVANPQNFWFDNFVASITSPSTSNSISWGSDTYTIGDNPSFTWTISNTDYPTTTWWAAIYKDGNPYYAFTYDTVLGSVEKYYASVPQTGTFMFSTGVNDIGTYRVDLVGTTSVLGIPYSLSTATATDSMTMTVARQPYLVAPPQVSARFPFSVSYDFGSGGLVNPVIAVYFGSILEGYFQASGTGTGTMNITVNTAGGYILKLFDVNTGKYYASKSITSVSSAPLATMNITSSSIKIDKTQYYWDDLIVGNYSVDNTNWTAGLTYIDIYNDDIDAVTTEYFDNIDFQVQNFMKQITPYKPATATSTKTLYLGGNNLIRLMLKYSNGTSRVLANASFYLNEETPQGYMLKLSKNNVVVGETFYASIKIPESNDSLVVRDLQARTEYYRVRLNYSSVTISKALTISKVGTYEVALQNNVGYDVLVQPVNVIASDVTAKPTVPAGWGNVSDTNSQAFTVSRLDSYVGTMGYGVNNTTRMMFSVVVIILFIILAALATKGNSPVAITCGFLPFAFFTIVSFSEGARAAGIEFLPKWPAVMFILLVAASLRIFR